MNALSDKEIMQEPYICIHQDLTVDINYSFSVLTSYNREEIIGKDILYILNDKLRINKKVTCIDEFLTIESLFFFNKLLDFKECSIDIQKDLENELTYLIFIQRPLLSINNPLSYTHQLISDNFTGIAIYSAEDFTLLKASKEYKKIICDLYYETDIIGKKVYEFIQGWLESPARIEWEMVIQNKKAVVNMECPISNPITGKLEYFDLSIAPMLDYNKVKYLVIAQNNVTEKVNYRQQLVSQNKQLAAIIDNMSDIMYILDQDERYVMQNKAAIEYFNLDLENLYDSDAPFRYYEPDGTMIPFEEMPIAYMKRGIKVLDRVVRIKTHNRDLYSSVSATPIFDQQGNYLLGIVSIRDLTEYMKRNETIKEQQQALLLAEKKEKENLEKVIEMKDEFLSLISHEFKTPLTVINSALQVMELLYNDQIADKAKIYLDKIKQNTYRQVRLVNNLLDITCVQAGHIKVYKKDLDIIFITNAIVESVRLYAQQKGVNIYFKADQKEKIIALDEEKYERILLNLLSNAIKFTPKDKSITVEITCKPEKVTVMVKDEGIGIPDEKRELIFERFGQVDSSYTRQAEGSGIGLYLVKLMANAIGGCISFESQVGAGSSFFVELPDMMIGEEQSVETLKELIDTRLIQSIAVEFSDIYF